MLITRRTFAAGLVVLGLGRAVGAQAPAAFAPETVRADFDELYERLRRAHFDLFAHRSRTAYDRVHDEIRKRLDRPLPADDVLALFQRFVAFGRIAHARIDAAREPYRAFRAAGGRVFPLAIRVKHGRAFVLANNGGAPDPTPGEEVVEIDGSPTLELIDSLWQDLSADTAYMLHSMIEWELPRLLWQRFGARAAFDLLVRSPDGTPRRVQVPARSQAELDAAPAQPASAAGPTDRSYRVVEGSLGYFRPGPFYAAETPATPYDNRAFVGLVDEAFGVFTRAGVRRLLIDLRDNPGGDNSFSDHLVAWFAARPFRFASAFRIKVTPETVASNRARLAVAGNDPTGISAALEQAYSCARMGSIIDFPIPLVRPRAGARFAGEAFVLVNRHSYSNTVSIAALIQDHGFGTIIGEETADLATTYGAMESFALSRTGIAVGYPKARIVRVNGSLEGRGVVPDIAIDNPVVETPGDTVLDRALAIVRGAPPRRAQGA